MSGEDIAGRSHEMAEGSCRVEAVEEGVLATVEEGGNTYFNNGGGDGVGRGGSGNGTVVVFPSTERVVFSSFSGLVLYLFFFFGVDIDPFRSASSKEAVLPLLPLVAAASVLVDLWRTPPFVLDLLPLLPRLPLRW